jgi:hypothetical protein
MYIIAIAWLYVTTLMAFAETSFVAGVLTFVFYGLLPVALLLFLLGTPARRQRRAARESVGVAADELADQPDRGDAERNQ